MLLMRREARFDLAVRLRDGAATIGEVFTFMSGLYFRGKMAYAAAFADPPEGCPGVRVIVPGVGLAPPDYVVDLTTLRLIAQIPVDKEEVRYREPLLVDARGLAEKLGHDTEVVLLGSVATEKYISLLSPVFGERLKFPGAFVGRGDMSRGSLMLKCTRERRELGYIGLTATCPS